MKLIEKRKGKDWFPICQASFNVTRWIDPHVETVGRLNGRKTVTSTFYIDIKSDLWLIAVVGSHRSHLFAWKMLGGKINTGIGRVDPEIRFSKMRFIVNPAAGKRRGNVEDSIRKALRGSGVTFDVIRTGYRGHATALSREAADDGVDLVVAVGGDGTLNEVGRGLLEKRGTVLGLLPTGSGNAFAHALGIPRNPGRACENLFQAIVQPIDVGRIGEEFFFSTAGVALDAEVSWQYNKGSGGPRGFLPYAILTLCAFRTYKPEAVCVKLEEGLDLRVHPTILTVANTSQFGNGAMIAPGARPDDGLLDLCIIETNTLPRTLWHVRRLFTGTIDKMPGSKLLRTRGLRIVRSGPGRFQVDGEAMTGGSTLEVAVVPKAIRMAFPRNSN